jgi:hypothetical protein
VVWMRRSASPISALAADAFRPWLSRTAVFLP